MKLKERKFLLELMKNSKKSDRKLAVVLGVSQPTITRMRGKLEENETIKGYTAIVDLAKLGYAISAFTFIKIKFDTDLMQTISQWIETQNEIIYASEGLGLQADALIVSLHKDYTGLDHFLNNLRRACGEILKDLRTFTINLQTEPLTISKPFSFKDIS